MYTYQNPPGLRPGQFLFEHRFPVGQGGLGKVDAVQVVDSNRSHPIGAYLARKRLNSSWARDPRAQARFEQEIELLSDMDHPNIVSVEGVSLPGGERAYFMPLFPGSLRSRLEANEVWSLLEVAMLGVQVAQALSYAHDLGFAHRDLKPDNILLDQASNPVLCDWGLGQFIHVHSRVLQLTHGGPLGTAYYCDLQQWSTGDGGILGDVYSLGMTLGELAFGSPPELRNIGFGIEHDVLHGNTIANRHFNDIIRRMTNLVRERRYANMVAVEYALRTVLSLH